MSVRLQDSAWKLTCLESWKSTRLFSNLAWHSRVCLGTSLYSSHTNLAISSAALSASLTFLRLLHSLAGTAGSQQLIIIFWFWAPRRPGKNQKLLITCTNCTPLYPAREEILRALWPECSLFMGFWCFFKKPSAYGCEFRSPVAGSKKYCARVQSFLSRRPPPSRSKIWFSTFVAALCSARSGFSQSKIW